MKGVFHVHSTFSHDGKCSLPQIAGLCREKRFRFAMITEHAEDFEGQSKMQSFIEECRAVSTREQVLLVPGLEFGFKEYPKLHLLGIGLSKLIFPADIERTIDEIHQQGGLAVIAHPTRNRHFIPEHIMGQLDGIEVWNAAYDSRYMPHYKSMKLFTSVKRFNPDLKSYCGLDFHRAQDLKGISITVTGDFSCWEDLIGLFKKGSFSNSGFLFTIKSRPGCGPLVIAAMKVGRWLIEHADPIVASFRRRTKKA